jgi:hypothetical protein
VRFIFCLITQFTYNFMVNKEYIAQELYTTYCASVGGVAFNGDPLPTAQEFFSDPTKKKQSDAWLATAQRAMDLLF